MYDSFTLWKLSNNYISYWLKNNDCSSSFFNTFANSLSIVNDTSVYRSGFLILTR